MMLPRTSFELFKKERFYLENSMHSACMQAEPTIPVRKQMLTRKQEKLRQSIRELEESVAYIDWKQNFR